MDNLDQLDELICTEHRLMTIESYDQERIEAIFAEFSRTNNKAYYLAKAGRGMVRLGAGHIEIPHTHSADEILQHIHKTRHYGIYILCDFEEQLEIEENIALLKSIATGEFAKLVILLSDFIDVPDELKPYTVRVKHQMRHAAN